MLAIKGLLTQEEEEREDPNFERRIDEITTGLDPFIRRHLLEKVSRTNASTIVDYVQAFKIESNPKENSIQAAIMTLIHLYEWHKERGNAKSFREMTRDDIIAYLNRLRKSDEEDPLHHWIGTYANNVVTIKRFFKWLYYPMVEPAERPNPEPIQNVRKLLRKEKEIYKDTELWKDSDCNEIIFKYVTSARDRAFHAMMLDTLTRPKELIGAKIKDLVFEDTGYNQKVAFIWLVGKSGKRIKKPLAKSLHYLRDWLNNGHPRPEDPNAYILCGCGNRNLGRKLRRHTFSHIYIRYRKRLFPSLLESPEVPEKDKQIIREKILTKPIKPYILRHTSITEKSEQGLGEYNLRYLADWTPTSKMPQRYIHFGGNESANALLKAQGIIPVNNNGDGDGNGGSNESLSTALKPSVICYHCKEPNKPEAKFCSNPKCGMVLKFEAASYIESIEEKTRAAKEAEQAREELRVMKQEHQIAIEEMRKTIEETKRITGRMMTNSWLFHKGRQEEEKGGEEKKRQAIS